MSIPGPRLTDQSCNLKCKVKEDDLCIPVCYNVGEGKIKLISQGIDIFLVYKRVEIT